MVKQFQSTISLDEGRKALNALLASDATKNTDWNEADTRFQFIDKLITDCLGWPKQSTKLEHYQDGKFADYILGEPYSVIWEAKKEGYYFELPANFSRRALQSLSSIMAVSSEAEKAIRQVHTYCTARGVEFAVVCNGLQLIAFLAIRIGKPPLEGQALVFQDHNQMKSNFAKMWQNLSPEGIAERRLHRLLTTGSDISLPQKPSSHLLRFPVMRYQSNAQSTLRSIAELIIEDIPDNEDIEQDFLRQCYCETGALSRDSLMSRRLLMARYAALFPDDDGNPRVEPASSQKEPLRITTEIVTEAVARRPIVLLGDVGVGKTSFIKQLMLLKASNEFKNSINIYIDLGSKAALELDLRKFILKEIERQLQSRYDVDVEDADFVRGVYDLDVKRFRNSVYGKAYRNNTEKYEESVLSMLMDKLADRSNHLKKSIEHISKARRRQVILILDNSDQRSTEIQQDAFIVAQEFAGEWNAMVFISVRPQTFFQSKRSGALSAYPHKVFTIAPPRPELVIEKRLQFTLNVAEGKISPEKLRGISINLEDISLFLKALLFSMKRNIEIRELLSNITGGNIRAIVEFVVKFIGSPNVDAEKIIRIQRESGTYLIPIHEFSKAAILGDYSHYNPESSMALNLFDVQYPDEKEHFLAIMILEYLDWGESAKDRDGFVSADNLVKEMQSWGFLPRQIEGKLRRLNNWRLIESTERITFEEDETVGLIGRMPQGFRITTVGMYRVKRWAGIFAYLDAMLFDTPIFDKSASNDIVKDIEEFAIRVRLDRAKIFRKYLKKTWNGAKLNPTYFNWNETVDRGNIQFERVSKVVNSIAKENKN